MKVSVVAAFMLLATPAFACDYENPDFNEFVAHEQAGAPADDQPQFIVLSKEQELAIHKTFGAEPRQHDVFLYESWHGKAQLIAVKDGCVVDHSNQLPLNMIMAIIGKEA